MPSASAVNLAPPIRPPLPKAEIAPSDPQGPDFAGLLNATTPPPPDNSARPSDEPPPRSPRRADAGNDDPQPQQASTDIPKPASDRKGGTDAPASSDASSTAEADGKTDKDAKAGAAHGKDHAGHKKADTEAVDTSQVTDAIAAASAHDAQTAAAPQSTDTATALAAAIPGATPAAGAAQAPASGAADAISSINAAVAATSTTAAATVVAIAPGKEDSKDVAVAAGPVATTNGVKVAVPNAAGSHADAKVSGKTAVAQDADATGTTDSEKVQPQSTNADAAETKPAPDIVKSAQTTDGGKTTAAEHAKAKPDDAPAFDPTASATADTPPPPTAGGLIATAPTSSSTPVAVAAAATSNGATVPVAGLAVEIASHVKDGNRSFDIRLDPPELGRIHVRLDIDTKGNVTSHLTVDRADTYDLLRRDFSGLERALNDAGLKTADNSMQFTMRDQSFSGGQQQRQSGDFTSSARVIVPAEAEALAGPARYMLPRLGGVDIKV